MEFPCPQKLQALWQASQERLLQSECLVRAGTWAQVVVAPSRLAERLPSCQLHDLAGAGQVLPVQIPLGLSTAGELLVAAGS